MLPIHNINVIAADEGRHLEELRQYNIQRRIIRDQSNPFDLNEKHFIDMFRLNKISARYVFERIQNWMEVRGNPVAVPSILRFFAALNFYATGCYQRTVGQNFIIGLSQQSISNAVGEVTAVILHTLSNQWIHFPNTPRELNQIKNRFMEATRFPGVVGAIDCTHIAIKAPHEEHNYVNRKGFHSKNVQFICDYNLRILNVNANYTGATHDSFIWRHSAVQTTLQNLHRDGNTNTWLVGDSGYPQQPWLMTPILHANEGTPEFRYTKRQMHARNCIERCFGVLKGRFRCLLKERVLRLDPNKVGLIVNVCSLLHNICMDAHMENNYDIPPNDEDGYVDDNNLNIINEGNVARRNLIRLYFE